LFFSLDLSFAVCFDHVYENGNFTAKSRTGGIYSQSGATSVVEYRQQGEKQFYLKIPPLCSVPT